MTITGRSPMSFLGRSRVTQSEHGGSRTSKPRWGPSCASPNYRVPKVGHDRVPKLGHGIALRPQALGRGTRRLVVEAAPLQEGAHALAELVLVAACEETQPLEAGLVGALVLTLILL